ncbi:MAG: 1-acyl-sn-glycerol-3-phosphate acyltransferase [Myxococcota bacterium]
MSHATEPTVPCREPGVSPQPELHRPSARLDIGQELRAANPQLASRVPRFAVSGLERLLLQHEVNTFLSQQRDLSGAAVVEALLRELQIDIDIGGAPWPKSRRLVVVANHPTGILDGAVLSHILAREYGGVRVLANAHLSRLEIAQDWLVPVARFGGRLSREQAKRVREVLDDNTPLLVFPAGEVAKFGRRGAREVPWAYSFLHRARKWGRTVVPVHLSGHTSPSFHLVSVLRRLLRMDFHVEQLLLVRELRAQRGATVTATVGHGIEPEDLPVHGAEATEYVRRHTLALATSMGTPKKGHPACKL